MQRVRFGKSTRATTDARHDGDDRDNRDNDDDDDDKLSTNAELKHGREFVSRACTKWAFFISARTHLITIQTEAIVLLRLQRFAVNDGVAATEVRHRARVQFIICVCGRDGNENTNVLVNIAYTKYETRTGDTKNRRGSMNIIYRVSSAGRGRAIAKTCGPRKPTDACENVNIKKTTFVLRRPSFRAGCISMHK